MESFMEYVQASTDRLQIQELESKSILDDKKIERLQKEVDSLLNKNKAFAMEIGKRIKENNELKHTTKILQEQINNMFNSVEDRYYELEQKYSMAKALLTSLKLICHLFSLLQQ